MSQFSSSENYDGDYWVVGLLPLTNLDYIDLNIPHLFSGISNTRLYIYTYIISTDNNIVKLYKVYLSSDSKVNPNLQIKINDLVNNTGYTILDSKWHILVIFKNYRTKVWRKDLYRPIHINRFYDTWTCIDNHY